MKKLVKVTVVPVKLARRCGLEGFSTVAAGGFFSLDLWTLRANVAQAIGGGSVELDCLWMSVSGLECAEPEWLAHHYPEMAF